MLHGKSAVVTGSTSGIGFGIARRAGACGLCGFTINCISPGYVWTPLAEKQIPDQMKTRNMNREQVIEVLLAAQPTKKFITVEQVAALTVYLCSDDAAPITGANLSIDGGFTAQ